MSLSRVIKNGFAFLGYTVGRSAAGLHMLPLSRVGVDVLRDVSALKYSARSPATIFDIGANRGQSLRELRSWFSGASIHCFEPDPSQFAKIDPDGRDDKTTKNRTAVGSEDGEVELILAASSEGNSILPFDQAAPAVLSGGWTVQKNSIRVPMTRIDTYCHRNDVDHIDILKSDTQGNELQVLLGAGDFLHPARISVVIVEAIFRPMYKGQGYFVEIFGLLASKGFRFVAFYNESRDADGTIVWCDALFFGSC